MIKFSVRRDTLTPDIRLRLSLLINKAPNLRAVAEVLAETAKATINAAHHPPA